MAVDSSIAFGRTTWLLSTLRHRQTLVLAAERRNMYRKIHNTPLIIIPITSHCLPSNPDTPVPELELLHIDEMIIGYYDDSKTVTVTSSRSYLCVHSHNKSNLTIAFSASLANTALHGKR
jgi:hypothetical protein